MELPDVTTPQGMYDWLLIAIILLALAAGLLIGLSVMEVLPPIDQLDAPAPGVTGGLALAVVAG